MPYDAINNRWFEPGQPGDPLAHMRTFNGESMIAAPDRDGEIAEVIDRLRDPAPLSSFDLDAMARQAAARRAMAREEDTLAAELDDIRTHAEAIARTGQRRVNWASLILGLALGILATMGVYELVGIDRAIAWEDRV